MDCPHLCASVKLNRDFIKNKKSELAVTVSNTTSNKIWKCTECDASKENWLCLNCGSILCGRYQNKHALIHSESKENHNVCMNTLNYSVYCYSCDNYINDTPAVDELRQELRDDYDSASETSLSTEDSSVKSHPETTSTTSSDSGWDEPQLGRKLRPRKRTISSDSNESSSTTTLAKKKSINTTNKKNKVVGLRNLGNTCFMNSVLQSLSNIQEFSCYFNALPSLETKQRQRVYHSRSLKENCDDANVVEELRKVLLNLSQGGDGTKAISPECLFLVIWKVVPQFRGHRQHDAHEFLRYMLDRLHTELQHVPPITTTTSPQSSDSKSSPKSITNSPESGISGGNNGGNNSSPIGSGNNHSFRGRSSIVTNVFGGTLQSEVRCLVCGMESKKYDPFLDLSLDIPEKYYDCDDDGKAECHILDCLASFTEVEELTETELYYCSSCKCKQKSTKRFWIRRLPNVLCLHIKRFRWSNFFRTKIDLKINFPIKSLDMSQYVLNNGPETRRCNSSNNIYDLVAVIVHHGNGSSCGHYTAFAINNGSWLHFNDHSVKEVPPTTVADCKPYILFYIRRDTNKSTS